MNSEHLSMWYDAYNAPLRLYARHWLGDEDSRDAVQTAFVRLMGQALAPRDVQAWLFRTVRNDAITRLRRRARRRNHYQQLSKQQQSWFESHPDDLIDARKAQETLCELPEAQREVVILRIWGQLSLKQIAKIVHSPLTTVHGRYKTALAAIKERMQQSCKTTTK